MKFDAILEQAVKYLKIDVILYNIGEVIFTKYDKVTKAFWAVRVLDSSMKT